MLSAVDVVGGVCAVVMERIPLVKPFYVHKSEPSNDCMRKGRLGEQRRSCPRVGSAINSWLLRYDQTRPSEVHACTHARTLCGHAL